MRNLVVKVKPSHSLYFTMSSSFLFILILLFFGVLKCSWSSRVINNKNSLGALKLSADVLSKIEMNKFMVYAYEKMGYVNCVTFIWDNVLSRIIESLSCCPLKILACSAYKYEINFEGGNMSSEIMTTLSAGYQRQCGGYVILLHSPHMVTQFLHNGDDMKLINTRARYLIWYNENDPKFEGDEIWRKISNVILFHSKSKKKESSGNGGSRVLFTVRGIRWPVVIQNISETKTHLIEFWNYNGTDTEPSNHEWYYDKTTDWKKSTIKILVVEHAPGVMKSLSLDGEIEYSGTEVELVKALSIIMNFNYEFIETNPEIKWGGQEVINSTKIFFGSVARLIDGETDMAIGSFFILQHYLDYIDMSIPLDVACTSFLTPGPQQKPRFLALIVPFNFKLWILIIVICLIIGPFILFSLTRLGHVQNKDHAVFTKKIHTILTSFRIMSQVALHFWPKTWPIRIYIGMYWLFWLCVTIAYRSTMVSFLTIPLFEEPIDSLNDLVKSGLRIGGWGHELHRLFSEHEGSGLENQNQNILVEKYEMIDNVEDGISLVAEGTFALFENIRFLRFIRMTRNLTRVGSPSMRVMKQCIVPVHIGFAYQKNSAITHTINRFIRRFQESGLIKKWGQRLITDAKVYGRRKLNEPSDNIEDEEDEDNSDESEDTQKKSRNTKILTIRDLQGSIYLLFLGIGLSTIAFIMELIVYKCSFQKYNPCDDNLKKLPIASNPSPNYIPIH